MKQQHIEYYKGWKIELLCHRCKNPKGEEYDIWDFEGYAPPGMQHLSNHWGYDTKKEALKYLKRFIDDEISYYKNRLKEAVEIIEKERKDRRAGLRKL